MLEATVSARSFARAAVLLAAATEVMSELLVVDAACGKPEKAAALARMHAITHRYERIFAGAERTNAQRFQDPPRTDPDAAPTTARARMF